VTPSRDGAMAEGGRRFRSRGRRGVEVEQPSRAEALRAWAAGADAKGGSSSSSSDGATSK